MTKCPFKNKCLSVIVIFVYTLTGKTEEAYQISQFQRDEE